MLWSYKKIMVAVEDGEVGEHLCKFISDQNWSCDAEFRLVHVVQPDNENDPALLAESIMQSVKYGRFVLDRCASKLKESLHLPVDENLTVGYVIDQIEEEIKNWNPDLLIVGSHGRSALGKWFFGSVSETLLSHVSCPVMVIRPPKDNRKTLPTTNSSWSKIVIAVEDNSQSRLLIDQIGSHNWAKHTSFTVLHVVEKERIEESASYARESNREHAESQAYTLVKGISNKLKAMLPECQVHEAVIVGSPSKDLLSYTARAKADLLIAGSHGREKAAKWFLGSVSAPLLSGAQCGVVVIRPSKENAMAAKP